MLRFLLGSDVTDILVCNLSILQNEVNEDKYLPEVVKEERVMIITKNMSHNLFYLIPNPMFQFVCMSHYLLWDEMVFPAFFHASS
jgi:hypothetical protein